MSGITINGLHIEVEIDGAKNGEPLFLLNGLSMQLVDWPQGLVDQLVAAGFRVIRHDPRDIGLSEKIDVDHKPNVDAAALLRMFGFQPKSPYTLSDLTDDTIGIMDALGIRSAHVCGFSMGGMVAQHLAARFSQRIRSLCLISSTSGSPWLPPPDWRVMAAMRQRPPSRRDFDALLAHFVALYKMLSSPAFPESDNALAERLAGSLRRSYRPDATARQLLAVLADGDRSSLLRDIALPTQIIHGSDDPLAPVAAGRDLAKSIRDARLDCIDGMAHDLPETLWPRFVERIVGIATLASNLESQSA